MGHICTFLCQGSKRDQCGGHRLANWCWLRAGTTHLYKAFSVSFGDSAAKRNSDSAIYLEAHLKYVVQMHNVGIDFRLMSASI